MIFSNIFFILFNVTILLIAMTDDDVDEVLKKRWIEVLNPYNGELINEFCRFNKII